MATSITAQAVWANAQERRGPAPINSESVAEVLLTALPSSLLKEVISSPAAASREIASELAGSNTPAWFESLPYAVKTYLDPAAATSSSHQNVQSSSHHSSQAARSSHSSQAARSSHSSQAALSSHHSSQAASSSSYVPPVSSSQQGSTTAPDSSTQYSMPQSSSPSFGIEHSSASKTTVTRTIGTAPHLFSASGSATASPTTSHSSGSHTGAIAGGVVGGVAGLALIGVGAIFLLRRRKQKQRVEPMSENSFSYSGTEYSYR